MPAKRKASAEKKKAEKEPEAGTRRSTRGASATSDTKSAAGTKRKASPSPSPAPKKAASAKKGRTKSPSPAPEVRQSRSRAASTKKPEPKAEVKPAAKPPSRSASNQKGRVTRNVVQEEEKKTAETKSRSSSRGAKAPATPKNSATPKSKAVTPSPKVATPKKKAETPKEKATPRGRSATPKQAKATPKQAAITPKQKSTPKQKTTPRQKQQTPQKKSEPAPKRETPKSSSKKKNKPESPPKSSRSRRSKIEEPAEEVEEDAEEKQATDEKAEMEVEDVPLKEEKPVEDAKESVATSEETTDEPSVNTDKTEEEKETVENKEEKTEETETVVDAEKEKIEDEQGDKNEEEDNEKQEIAESKEEDSPEVVEEEMETDAKDETEQSAIEANEIEESDDVTADDQTDDSHAVKESADDVNLVTDESENKAEENVEGKPAEVSATMQQSEENSAETNEDITEQTSVDLVANDSSKQSETNRDIAEENSVDLVENDSNEEAEANEGVSNENSADINADVGVAKDNPVDLVESDSNEGVEIISELSEDLSQKVTELNEDSGEAIITQEEPAVVNDLTNVEVGNGGGDRESPKKVALVEEISDDDIEEIDTKQNNLQGNGAATDEIEVIEFVDQEDKYVENCPTKRKIDDVENQEEDNTSPLKKARISTEEGIQENGSGLQEDVAKEYVVIEMGDVPAPDSTEVQTSLPNAIFNRSFIPNPTFSGASDNSKQFSIVSYNILADCHLFRNDYSFTESKYLQPEYRLKNVIEELRYLDADVVCLQEVDPDFFVDQLLPAMRSHGYEGVHKQREGEYYNEGEATFFKTDRFTVVETEASTFSQLLEKELDGIDPDIQEAVKKYTNLPDVVIVTKLQCKNTGNEVTVGNVHIHWGEMKMPDAQCVQIASAVKEIVSKASGDNFPHIICGDFNSPPMSAGYLVARDGYPSGDETINNMMKIEGLEMPEGKKASLVNSLWPAFQHTSSSLRSAYSEAQGYEPEISSYNCVMCDTVDYIFYSSMSLENVGVLQTAGKERVMETGGIPNQSFPSDHVSIKAVLSFK